MAKKKIKKIKKKTKKIKNMWLFIIIGVVIASVVVSIATMIISNSKLHTDKVQNFEELNSIELSE